MIAMRQEIRNALLSKQFLFSFVLLFLCFLGYSGPGWFCALDIEPEYRESALQLSIGSIFFGSIMMQMPFCAAVSHAVSQVEELNSGVMRWRVLRSSIKRYASVKMSASALSAACSTALAFVIHAVIWNIIAIPVDPIQYPAHEIGFSETCVFSKWYLICHGLPMYAEMTLGIAFSAAIWSIVALAVAVWIPDRLLTVSIPACIYFIWHLQLPYYLFGVRVPHPGTLYNDALTLESALQCILAYTVVFASSLFVYLSGLKRRACNA